MKRIVPVLSTIALTLAVPAGMAAASSNTVTCGISNTGKGSTNSCLDSNKNTFKISCSNNDTVVNSNNQHAKSGSFTSKGNTFSSGGSTGNANNKNNVSVTIGDSCAPVTASSPTKPTSPSKTKTPKTTAPAKTSAPAAKSQVAAPAGSVHAGGGAGVATNSAEVIGLAGSSVVAITGAAIVIRKRVFGQ
ncbi:MAG: hypothetical protein ACREGA_04670 [Candidatus Saccharimonadales bacterium]